MAQWILQDQVQLRACAESTRSTGVSRGLPATAGVFFAQKMAKPIRRDARSRLELSTSIFAAYAESMNVSRSS